MGDDLLEPDSGWDEVADHPGEQCHEVHPHRPHRIPKPRPVASPPAPPPAPAGPRWPFELGPDQGAATVDRATALVLLGSDPWGRFDLWSQRAWELAEKAIAAAGEEGTRNAGLSLASEATYDPRASTQLDAAKMCADIAQAVCPLAALAGLPGRLPDLELELPTPFLG